MEGKGEKEKERERNINVWLPLMCSLLGTWPTTQAYALIGNQIGNPLVCRPALNTLSHTSQGRLMSERTVASTYSSWEHLAAM